MNTIDNNVSDLTFKLINNLDLDDYEDIVAGRLVLLNPKTNEPSSAYIELASPEHQARKRIDLARTRKLRSEYSQTGKMPSTDPVDDIEEETDYLVASTLGWNLSQGGAPVLFTAEAARKLFTDPKKQWVRAQALAGLRKTELFIKDSAKA
ncbi:hypothetical protein [Massilia aquatica]|uniref:Uncharacterized protein n=1 Tax=Massilia aquatica TaxID=2609000 RepID=A0ABX0MA00_9BURK|nr:hypothetical protein [Massilia aquatica]NHZ41823.1 hypothetical protein [Massilia aquatica]